MNTRHFLHIFYTFDAAGAQVRSAALMRHFGAGYRHSVVAQNGRAGAIELVGDSDVRLIDSTPPTGPASGVRFFRNLLQQQQPDLVLSYNWGTIDVAMAARSLGMRRLVHHEDGFNDDEAQRLKLRRNWTRRLVLADVDVVVPSRQLERIGHDKWGLRRLHFIPNGIEASVFSHDSRAGAAFRESLGIPVDATVIGAVGHLRKVKNFGRLLRAVAAADVSPIHLVLAGDGEERERLEKEAAAVGGLVHFAGHLRDLRPAYSAFDIFALSSDSEQQPVSLLEAMAAGLPVCATDVGDIRATLPASQHEFICPLGPSVEAAMADGLGRLARDPGRRSALGAENLRHVKEYYSETAMLGAYEKIYAGAQSR